jgi:hypothetical protein
MSKEIKTSPPGAFLSDVTELRQRARKEIEEGAVTPGYKIDSDREVTIGRRSGAGGSDGIRGKEPDGG